MWLIETQFWLEGKASSFICKCIWWSQGLPSWLKLEQGAVIVFLSVGAGLWWGQQLQPHTLQPAWKSRVQPWTNKQCMSWSNLFLERHWLYMTLPPFITLPCCSEGSFSLRNGMSCPRVLCTHDYQQFAGGSMVRFLRGFGAEGRQSNIVLWKLQNSAEAA